LGGVGGCVWLAAAGRWALEAGLAANSMLSVWLCESRLSFGALLLSPTPTPTQQKQQTMPLESCMVLLDTSEFMRNGDYIPTRLDAQSDAANMIVNQKTQSNPESTVGVIAMSSSGPSAGAELLVSPTDDLGKILSALHGVPLCGKMVESGKDAVDVAASVQVATLALKHRRNKNGAQRIVLFVGSPLDCADSRSLVKAGKQLKKNNVFIDVIAMGELEGNEPKLRELVDAANGTTGNDDGAERNCHLVTIPAGVLPSDVLVSSPILRGDGGGGGANVGGAGGTGAGGGGDAFAEYGGIDPNMDPELAMALRVSMEEERARQERAAALSNETKEEENSEDAANADQIDVAAESGDINNVDAMNDEDALLQQALAMSMAETENQGGDAGGNGAEGMDTGAEDEDAAMQMALQMSMQAEGEEQPSTRGAASGQFQDPAFVSNVSDAPDSLVNFGFAFPCSVLIYPTLLLKLKLLGSLPGVNPNDPAIQEALRKANEESDKNEKKEDGNDK
jgi:26S proteasome regulatory subunit N10